jgi:hypothetical protein
MKSGGDVVVGGPAPTPFAAYNVIATFDGPDAAGLEEFEHWGVGGIGVGAVAGAGIGDLIAGSMSGGGATPVVAAAMAGALLIGALGFLWGGLAVLRKADARRLAVCGADGQLRDAA